MAEYQFGPYHYDEDITKVYDAVSEYFVRGGRAYNVTSNHFDDDRFYLDFLRSYSFVATEFKATINLKAMIAEDGGTDIRFKIKSQDTEERLKKDICDRIYEGIRMQLLALEGKVPEPEEKTEEEKKKDKRNLIIGLVVAGVIMLGALPISLNPGNWGF